jgi:molecular chaperone GrpE
MTPDPRFALSPEADANSAEAETRASAESDPASEPASEERPVAPPEGEGRGPDAATEAEGPDAATEAEEPDAATEAEEPDHEAQLEHDLEELSARAAKADEYLELAQRTKADFENYRKRATKEAAAAQERGVVKLALELLPAVDNLDRALAAIDGAEDSETLASGIKLVQADVIAALAKVGIEPYSPQGERFDPQHHEAVAQQPVEGAESGTIVEVYQRGYRLRDSVLRPARVVVAA